MSKTAIYTRRAIDNWRANNREKYLEQSKASAKRYYEKIAEWKAVTRQFRLIDISFFT